MAEGSGGPDVVRLTAGLARRASGGTFRYLCPAAWGDEVVLPAASIPGGPIVVAGSHGVFTLDAAGVATAHPDPLAGVQVTDFVQLAGKLYGLRNNNGTVELWEVDATHVRVLFSEPGSWSTVAATASEIAFQRLNGEAIEQLKLSADGTVLARDSAPAPQDPLLVLARATSSQLYSVVATASGRELGQIQDGKWVRLELAAASIGGPVELPSGEPFVALDTELFRLPEPRVALEGMPAVNCLGRYLDRAYACTREGLAALEQSGVGSAIFQLSSLLPPELDKVAESQRDACQLQWEHFRFDLLALGVTLAEPPSEPPPTAAGTSGTAGAPAAGAPTGTGGVAAPAPPEAGERGGCALSGSGRPRGAAWWGVVAVVALVWASRRSAQRRRRARERAAQ